MRIPLDYYRILSVPVKATAEQLEQAYSDRLLQQPRREYSDRAIKARRELIQHSYQVLSNLEQRATYDTQFLVNMQPVEAPKTSEGSEVEAEAETTSEVIEESAPVSSVANPTIEIPSSQIVGALLILHELGEYEVVLKIGIDYFNQKYEQQSPSEKSVLNSTQEDLILTLALAYLELGREQWHRQEYENAAVSGQMGIDLLEGKSLFPHLQEELELDLHKLRPYRVLELISQNSARTAERNKGFQLLQSMLIQRQGIEGKGSDRSGLSFDQFLCFIQQLRTYLTSAEQQQLFDNESQNDSAIAKYLAVYALLGRGFSLKQPELIIRAQRKLDSLSEKQDVSWEQAIAALLLGHTEKAIYKLKNAPNTAKLEQVEQHNVNSSDLLPGLCFYGEKWLLEDVVAQFSDLSTTQLTLKEYFADPEVQTYLEELAPPKAYAKNTSSSETEKQQDSRQNNLSEAVGTGILSFWRNLFATEKAASARVSSSNKMVKTKRELVTSGSTAGLGKNMPVAATTVSGDSKLASDWQKTIYRPTVAPDLNPQHQNRHRKKSPTLPLQPQGKTRAVPPSVMQKAQGSVKRKRAKKKQRSSTNHGKGRLLVFSLIMGVGVGAMAFIVAKLLLKPGVKIANEAQLTLAISQPAVELPPKKIEPVAAKPNLTFTERSRQVIQNWLSSKSAAFGKEYQIDRLDNILAEPLLTTWRERALTYKQGNSYREYEHNLTMRSAAIDPKNKNKATIEAEVREIAQHYQSGQLDNAQSYDDNLLVRYQLVRQGEKWLIENAEVLKTL